MTEQLPSLLKEPQPSAGVSVAPAPAPEYDAPILPAVSRAPSAARMDRALEWVMALGRVLERNQGFHIPEDHIRDELKDKLDTIGAAREYIASLHAREAELTQQLAQAQRQAQLAEAHVKRLETNLATERAALRPKPRTSERPHETQTDQPAASPRTDLEPDLQRLRARRADPAQGKHAAADARAASLTDADIWGD